MNVVKRIFRRVRLGLIQWDENRRDIVRFMPEDEYALYLRSPIRKMLIWFKAM